MHETQAIMVINWAFSSCFNSSNCKHKLKLILLCSPCLCFVLGVYSGWSFGLWSIDYLSTGFVLKDLFSFSWTIEHDVLIAMWSHICLPQLISFHFIEQCASGKSLTCVWSARMNKLFANDACISVRSSNTCLSMFAVWYFSTGYCNYNKFTWSFSHRHKQ